MKFRNNVIMSALLVTSYLCLYFYQESVEDKFRAYDSFLHKIVEEKRQGLGYMPDLIRSSLMSTRADDHLYKELKTDIRQIKQIVEKPSMKDLIASRKVMDKYQVRDKFLMRENQISNIAKYEMYSGVHKELNDLYEEAQCLAVQMYEKDMQIIIKDQKTEYKADESYALDLRIVHLLSGSNNPNYKDMQLYIEFDGIKHDVEHFPFRFDEVPDEYYLGAVLTNPTTGEKQKIRKYFKTKKNELP